MPLEQWRCIRRTVLKGMLALAGGLFAGCDDALPPAPGKPAIIGSVHVIGDGMYENFSRLRLSLKGADRDAFEALIAQKDLLLHVFLATGRIDPNRSRGGESGWASRSDMKLVCDFHPIFVGLAPERNWDVAYDPELAKWRETMDGIPNPPEVVLYHEIFGHVIPGLRNPEIVRMATRDELFRKTKECEALDIENRYRKQFGLREFSRKLLKCPSPER